MLAHGLRALVMALWFLPPAVFAQPGAAPAADRRLPAHAIKDDPGLRAAGGAVALVDATFATPGLEGSRPSETGAGVLIDPCRVVTARHVLGAPPLGDEERRIEVVFRPPVQKPGVARSGWVRRSARVLVQGGDRGVRRTDLLDDWAILALDRPVKTIKPVPVDDDWRRGALAVRIALAGYPIDQFDRRDPLPWVDPDCRVLEELVIAMIATNCQATSGNSGGPIFAKRDGGWRLAALLTRAQGPVAGGGVGGAENFALPLDAFLRRVMSAASVDDACRDRFP